MARPSSQGDDNDGQKAAEADWKAAGCSGTAPKIGSAAGIRASAFTVFVSAAVALVASR